MLPEQILEMIKNDHIYPNWQVFRYNKTRAILMLLYKLFFAGLFLGMAGALAVFSPKPLAHNTLVIVYPMFAIGGIAGLVWLHHLYTMFFLRSNMIVLTETGVLKSIRGKLSFWEYTQMTQLQQIVSQSKNSMPTYSVEFKNTSTNHTLELCRGNEFGPSQNIFTILKTKVS